MSKLAKIDYFKNLPEIVRLAIEEDVGTGDITAQLVPRDQNAKALVITREAAIVCGRPWFDEVFKQIDSDVSLNWFVGEGERVTKDQKIVGLTGRAQSILTAERTGLNLLQTLMSTATTSRKYAEIVKGVEIKILDTRKTIPGLRLAQKYAISIGGCENHRIGLYDAFLIKENHIAACGSIAKAVLQAREIVPQVLVEVEAENLNEVQQAIEAGADRIMLDNFSKEEIVKAVAIKESHTT